MGKNMDNKMDTGITQGVGGLFGGLHAKEHSVVGSILGSHYLGKVPEKSPMYKISREQLIRECII